jgi:phosphoglycolate phosphatase-like HAD superfamily hydrolase
MKIKYIGFDKDGTLMDSMDSYAKVWGEIFKNEYGIDAKEAGNFLINTAGQSNIVQVDTLLKNYGIFLSKEEVLKKSIEITSAMGEKAETKLFPDVKNSLEKLKKEGYKIFISSGQQEKVIRNDLEKANLTQYIDFIAGFKPEDPEYKKGEGHFRAAAKFFNVPFEEFIKEMVFIGDTQTDLDVASEFSVPCIIRENLNSKITGAKFFVNNFLELDRVIKQI